MHSSKMDAPFEPGIKLVRSFCQHFTGVLNLARWCHFRQPGNLHHYHYVGHYHHHKTSLNIMILTSLSWPPPASSSQSSPEAPKAGNAPLYELLEGGTLLVFEDNLEPPEGWGKIPHDNHHHRINIITTTTLRCFNCGDVSRHLASACPHPPLPKRCHHCKVRQLNYA